MRTVASRYNIIQLGLCTFTKSKGGEGKDEGQLVARPYNIFTCADDGEDVCLSLSAITFLRGNKMDFNTWLSKVRCCAPACAVKSWRLRDGGSSRPAADIQTFHGVCLPSRA